jgi:predicted nucleic acid-binding protein
MPSGSARVGFVADASATLPWCFEDEATPETEALLERLRAGEPALVPAHWPTEVMNGLIVAVRRGRIDSERVTRFARDLAALPIGIEAPPAPVAWDAVMRVATEYQLTVYDAAYLELAKRSSLPLASLDGDLRKAALAAGVVLLEA